MGTDRLIQVIAALIAAASITAAGVLLPLVVRQSEDHVLRYTNVSVEGAPPIVVLGTAIGAVRGLIVDYLWIKAQAMKERGQFYEAMADADLITKLQPRFGAVWLFHGHNMAYNISVATHTQQERWEWVNAGLRLVRDKGLRYNPNNLLMHRELAFWFAHKLEGVADDAHLYYKLAFCHEWHMLLGPPPDGYEQRIAWMKQLADAPETLQDAQRLDPNVTILLDRLEPVLRKTELQRDVKFDSGFLSRYQEWLAVKNSPAAKLLNKEEELRRRFETFREFDAIAADPSLQDAWTLLITHVRKRVLKDEYNMDPQLMYEYTRDLGPIDWRHGQAHALYWSRRGSQYGAGRLNDDDIYISLNNDSQQMQAMQDLARSGRITYDPISSDMPGRFPEPRWIDTIATLFEHFYIKNINVRGAGGERFITFLQNFMGSAIRELFRSGETERAQKYMDLLDSLFGRDNPTWRKPLDVFVYEQTYDQYQAQPHIAPSDVAASLKYGFKMGTLDGRPEVMRDALRFANTVTTWFKENSWNDYQNKFGVSRIADIMGDLEDSAEIAYIQLMTDTELSLTQRMAIWAQTDGLEMRIIREAGHLLAQRPTPVWRALAYDRIRPSLERQLAESEFAGQYSFEQAFPAPPGLDAQRQFLVQRERQRQQQREEQRKRDAMSRQGS